MKIDRLSGEEVSGGRSYTRRNATMGKGNDTFATVADTSLEAIEKGLKILKSGGMMSLCIYSGGDTGFDSGVFEKFSIFSYTKLQRTMIFKLNL